MQGQFSSFLQHIICIQTLLVEMRVMSKHSYANTKTDKSCEQDEWGRVYPASVVIFIKVPIQRVAPSDEILIDPNKDKNY